MCGYKLDKRKREAMENLDKCYRVVQQSRTGITAKDVAEKLKTLNHAQKPFLFAHVLFF